MLYLVGIVLTFFLALLLAGKKGKTTADRILAAWLMVIGVHLLAYYAFATGKNLELPHLLGFELPLPLLHGPFLYLYTRSVTGHTIRQGWWHFLPFLLMYVVFTEFFQLSPQEKIKVYEMKGLGFETVHRLNVWLIILSGIVYFSLSLFQLHRHNRNLPNQFSSTDKINLAWLRYLTFGIGFIWLSVMFGNETTTFALAVGLVIFIGYFGINQVGIFTRQPAEAPSGKESPDPLPTAAVPSVESPEEIPAKEKYQKSGLSAEAAEKIHRELRQVMETQKLFTNPELTLAELADVLQVHPNNLSQVINTCEQKSFYDYINLQRVDEFKRLANLPESQRFTLLGLAHNCGFNSKTSFNRNFKNATGLSPSDYLKQANILIDR